MVCSLALGLLSCLMLSGVSALRLPLSAQNQPYGFKWGPFPENSQQIPRSLELEDFALTVAPTTGRVNSPTIMRLQPVVSKPAHMHANLPLRFGRDEAPKSSINLPQRFGRSGNGPAATLPQRFGRRNTFALDPLLALAMYTRRATESLFPKERTQNDDYGSETTGDLDETLRNTDYASLD